MPKGRNPLTSVARATTKATTKISNAVHSTAKGIKGVTSSTTKGFNSVATQNEASGEGIGGSSLPSCPFAEAKKTKTDNPTRTVDTDVEGDDCSSSSSCPFAQVNKMENHTIDEILDSNIDYLTDINMSDTSTTKLARRAVEMAVKLNCQVGHENFGALSFSHGFAPMVTPTPRLPTEYQAWDNFASQMPKLLSSGRMRSFCENDLPLLDPTTLPPQYALRAAQILGYAMHAYWNVAGLKAPTQVPPALEEPWKILCTKHLKRKEPFMGFHELLVHAFHFDQDKGQHPPPPTKDQLCPYKRPDCGCVEYDPSGVVLGSFSRTMSLTGSQAEYAFYGVMTEMHCQGAGLVSLIVAAQEAAAALQNNPNNNGQQALSSLKESLEGLKDLLDSLTLESFAKIQQMKLAEFHVDSSIWSKVVAPVAVPIYKNQVGPSGTAAPLIIALDAFFGREEYSNFVGKEIKRLTDVMPLNWKRFVLAVRAGPKVGSIVCASGNRTLKGLFASCLRAFASDEGFLGRHTLKTTGYLEVGMKLGRNVTLGGFAGLLKDRAWEKVTMALRKAQEERFAVKLDAETSICQTARVIRNESKGDASDISYHVRLDIQDSGIRYRPGDRIGVLYESSEDLIRKTILALAEGNAAKANIIENAPVLLNQRWKDALRVRKKYHGANSSRDSIIPSSLPLREFLQYARLRPASRECVQVAYQATLDQWLYGFLESGRQSMLDARDIIQLIYRTHPNAGDMLLRGNGKRGRESYYLRFSSVKGIVEETGYDRLFQNADLDKSGTLSNFELSQLGFFLSQDSLMFTENDEIGKKEFVAMVKSGLVKLPRLCDLLEPAEFRVYSAASASCATPGELHLCVNAVQYNQKDPTTFASPLLADLQPEHERRGAASSYLGELSSGDCGNKEITIRHFQPPSFQLPPLQMNDASVLMFSAGSGIAPFRSFWQELAHRHSVAIAAGRNAPPKALMVIQAHSRATVPFVRELASLVGAGFLDVHICLSREDFKPDFHQGVPNWIPAKRSYVHNEISSSDLLNGRVKKELAADAKGYVYVCSGGGFARSIMDAIDGVVGTDAAEKMMASGRLSLEVFTSLKSPDPSLPDVPLSHLIFLNDFNGREAKIFDKSLGLRLAIDGLIYDMDAFASKHPGGRELLYLYCGTDASRAWQMTGHATAPEVASLLEMYRVGRLKQANREKYLAKCSIKLPILSETSPSEEEVGASPLSCPLHNAKCSIKLPILSETSLSEEEVGASPLANVQDNVQDNAPENSPCEFDKQLRNAVKKRFSLTSISEPGNAFLETTEEKYTNVSNWYADGWLPLTHLLVESQNATALAFMNVWDYGTITNSEPHEKDVHFCTWDGVTILRPKRSVLKGQLLADTHRRVWFEYIPTIIGEEFAAAIAPLDPTIVFSRLQTLAASSKHKEAAGLVCALEDAADSLGRDSTNRGYVPPSMHAILEEVRCMDERVVSLLKSGLSKALQGFENFDASSVFVREEQAEVDRLVLIVNEAAIEMVSALEEYCDTAVSLLQKGSADGFFASRPTLSEGGGCVGRFNEENNNESKEFLTAKRNLVGTLNINAQEAFEDTYANH